MRILHLYRPQLPSLRAQAIQVVHTCHALAIRGHRVTLLANRAERPADPITALGLAPTPTLTIRQSRFRNRGLAGVWFRTQLSRWWLGAPGVVLARDKKRLWDALQWLPPKRHRLVLETHELDSALAKERGDDPTPTRTLERRLLPRLSALVANCGGTLQSWRDAHGDALPRTQQIAHNAISPDRSRPSEHQADGVIRVVGSMKAYKNFPRLTEMAAALPLPIEWIGGDAFEADGIVGRPPVPYPDVPDLLARSDALLLPLSDNLFGRRLTSPLKLWDYLGTTRPIIAPDLPSVREIQAITGATMHFYAPDNADSLARAAVDALRAPPRVPFVRTWDTRAEELEATFAD
ncbi:MAG: glycosyltransferase [Myxococcota bacterium]